MRFVCVLISVLCGILFFIKHRNQKDGVRLSASFRATKTTTIRSIVGTAIDAAVVCHETKKEDDIPFLVFLVVFVGFSRRKKKQENNKEDGMSE